jgi:hypothetical protein
MRIVRRSLPLSLFAVLALSFAQAAADPPAAPRAPGDASLAGLWESEEPLGRGAALWLASSGEAVWGTGMFVDGTYAVRGDRLAQRFRLLPAEDEKSELQEEPLGRLTTSRWTRGADGRSETWERVGQSDRVTVEGTWTTLHRTGRTSYQRYAADGSVHVRMQVGPGFEGTWARERDVVDVRWKDGKRSTLKVVDGKLHVPSGASAKVVLTRRGAENWYSLRTDPPEFSTGRSPQADREIPGLWENTSKSLGGIGGAWWFEPSGRVLAATLVLADATYETKDGRLVMRFAEAPKPEEMPLGEVGPATWRIEEGGVALVKERIGPASEPPSVVGTWRYAHDTGGTAYERLGADGTWRFRLLITPAEVGTWSRHEDVLEVRWPQAPALTLRVQGGRLHDDSSEPKRVYAARMGDEDWYRLAGGWGPEPSRAP